MGVGMAYAASVGIGLNEAQLASIRRRAILACAIGNFFELFDFTIYGFFAVAISRAFYPSGSMYGTFAAFGAAFLMRPVGAIVLGAYGDRMGRRATPPSSSPSG
jgi:MFS transporter, MHS family, proline/betaine transporter